MSSETTALDILRDQVDNLTTQLTKLTSERDEYRDKLTEVSGERDTLKTKVSSPDAQAARIAELEAAVRDRAHFDKFAELAKDAKAKDAALKHLWRVSEYEAKDDEPDLKALGDLVKQLRLDVEYAFDPDESGTTEARPQGGSSREAVRVTSRTKYGLDMTDAPTPVGGGRSTERNKGGDGTIITQEMRADPRFMLDKRNQEMIRDAAIGGRFR